MGYSPISGSSPTVRPGRVATSRTASSTPGMNDARSYESCRIVRVSPAVPSSTSWWATSPRGPHRVHPHAVDVGAAGAVERGRRGVRHRPQAGVPAGGRHELRGTPGGAARRVGLAGVVQLDDLDGVEEPGRLLGEAHHQHGADREVGDHEDADAGGAVEPAAQLRQPVVVEAAGADDGVDAVLDAEPQVVHDGVRPGEVDGDLDPGVGQRRQRVGGPDAGHQLEVVGRVDRAARLRAHPPAGAEHARPWSCHRCGEVPVGLERADDRERRVAAGVSTSAAISATSSSVTASILASTWPTESCSP